MVFIDLTYALDKYAGVICCTPPASFVFSFESADVVDKAAGCVVEVTLFWMAGRDDSQVLAWYKKFNLCMISLFGMLWGFGGTLLCCFFAIEGSGLKSKPKFCDRPSSIAVAEPKPQQQHSNGMVGSIEIVYRFLGYGPTVL